MKPLRRTALGLTLIEVMVAIAIFAVLGVLSYRAVSSMIATRDRMEAEYARWRQIARVMQLIDNDLTQLAPRPTGGTVQVQDALTLMRGGTQTQLMLVRHDGSNGGVETRTWRVEDGTLLLTRQREATATQNKDKNADAGATSASADTSNARNDAMLDRVKSLNWRFVTSDGKESDTWPPGANLNGLLPAAIRMELELDDVGKVTRLFAVH
ncbi:type II secretion system minor pseudopilin GspJ [Niveibacterium sp.]|uniref:type II secretion system minor pseudopilin GspJ n=1 Tax=Niveibacterium sp. TaxID=2017444 RepID=UPI0035B3AD84